MIGNPRGQIASWALVIACALLGILHVTTCGAATDLELQSIRNVWQKRSIAVTSLQFNLRENESGIGDFCRHRSEWATSHSDREKHRHARLVVSGDKIRFSGLAWEYDDRILGIIPFYREIYPDQLREQLTAKRFDLAVFSGFQDSTLEEREPADYVSVFDGIKRVALWARAAPQLSSAVVWHSPPFYRFGDLYFHAALQAVPSLDEIVYVPLLMMYRPFHSWYGGIDPERCSILRREVIIDGHECLLVKERGRNKESDPFRLFFVCPRLDFAVLRYYADAGAEPHLQIDVEYRKDERFGWVPNRWTINRFNASTGTILEAARIEVSEFSINKPVAANEHFSIEFPERTWIRDFEKTEQFLSGRDGSRRRILDFEFRAVATDQQLIDSAPGESGDVSIPAIDMIWWHTLCGLAIVGGWAMLALGCVRLARILKRLTTPSAKVDENSG